MDRVPVESSNIVSVGYEPARYLLEIEFQSGAVYQYARVPSHIHQGLMQAESKGFYFLHFIRDLYPTTKLADARTSAAGTPDADLDDTASAPGAHRGPR